MHDVSRNSPAPWLPNWGRLWMNVQTEIVLLYAGFVKLNVDWLNLETDCACG